MWNQIFLPSVEILMHYCNYQKFLFGKTSYWNQAAEIIETILHCQPQYMTAVPQYNWL